MTYFTDAHKTVDITLKDINDVDWELDFYDVGLLTDLSQAEGYEPSASLYAVEDVDYLIDQAQDLIAGVGDFALQGPDDSTLSVRELDPDDEEEAAILSYVRTHPEVIAFAKTGVLGLDESLFEAACDAYEMEEDVEGYRFWLELNCGGPVGIGLTLTQRTATAVATTPDGPHELGFKAYEDFRDFADVADWLDECQEEAYDKYMPQELKEQWDVE